MSEGELRLLSYFEEGALKGQRLFQFEKYAIGTYRIPQLLKGVCDQRKQAQVPTFAVVNALLHAAVLRLPSINALEEELRTKEFKNLLGLRSREGKAAFSADTVVDVLDGLDLDSLEQVNVSLIKMAERNKAFRDDTFGTFKCAALDGWEPFCSYKRHCDGCLTRQVRVKEKDDDGTEVEVTKTQYYHRFVVAFLIAPKLDMTLAIEPVRSADLRDDLAEKESKHEGELTAALRLINRLHDMYGSFIDAFALDGLYPCGPILTTLTKYRYGAFIITKNKRKDPYRFAHEIWELRDGPDSVAQDPVTGESVHYWELDDVNALKSFDGSVKMLKAVVTRNSGPRKGKTSTWAMAMLGKARNVSNATALRIMRSRWHIENTAFHQWVTQWNLDHCYRHTANAITAVMRIWTLAFNLMQLFFYRRLRKPRRGRPVTDTIRAMVSKLYRDVTRFDTPVPWSALDSS